MVVRDKDVLMDLSARTDFTVCISVPCVDEDVWRALEPGTAHPMQRLRAVRELVDAGIYAGVLMAPIVPGVSSKPALARANAQGGSGSRGALYQRERDAPRRWHSRSLHALARGRASGAG
jgi:DNA repair photolyase